MLRSWFIGIVTIVLIAIYLSRHWISEFLSIPDAFQHPLQLILNFFIFAFGSSLGVRTLSWIWRKRKNLKPGEHDTLIIGLTNIWYLLQAGALFMTILGFWGIDYRTLFTTLSIVAAAIAIIAKDYISELISGIIISFSGEISIDDYVQIAGHKGKILDLTLTKVALLNDDDEIVFIPNNKVYSSEIINFTKGAIRRISVEFDLDIKALKTVEELERDLILAVSSYAMHIEPDSYALKAVALEKDRISFKFQYVLRHRDRELERNIRKQTIRSVVNYINTHVHAAEID